MALFKTMWSKENEETVKLLLDDEKVSATVDEVSNLENNAAREASNVTSGDFVAVKANLSTNQALVSLLKVILGTGIVGLPVAFRNSGLWFGIFGLIFFAAIMAHAMLLLVRCANFLRAHYAKLGQHPILDYEETVISSLRCGPRLAQRIARPAGISINIFVAVHQIGVCSVYIMFIAESIQLTVVSAVTVDAASLQLPHYKLLVTAVFLPLVFIPTIRKLSWLSVVGNVSAVLGLLITIGYCVADLPPIASVPAVQSFATIPLYFGGALFAFQAAHLVLPIENQMAHPEHMGGYSGVVVTCSGVALAFYCAIGFFGYLRFGDTIAASITFSLPTTSWYLIAVKPLYAASVFMTFLLQFYLLHQLTYDALLFVLPVAQRWRFTFAGFVRVGCLATVAFLAIAVPHLDLVIALIGAWAGAAICLIYPAAVHTLLFWNNHDEDRWFAITTAKDIFLVVVGLIGLITGTYSSIRDLYAALSN